jgi:hypothetical protein
VGESARHHCTVRSIRAAEAIFNHAAKAIEIEDIEARVAELERAAEAAKASEDDGVTA